MKLFYGFAYIDGRHTTSGSQDNIRIAGSLVAFVGKAARDHWMSKGYNVPVPHDMGEMRDAIGSRKLPMGWRLKDAVCEHGYCLSGCAVDDELTRRYKDRD